MRKKVLLFFLTFSVLAFTINAEDNTGAENISGFKPRLNGFIEYGYNYTWRSYCNIEASANLPFNPYFDMDAVLHYSTADLYTLGADLRPKFPLPVGELYLETKMIYRAITRNQMQNLSAALSLGYRHDHVRVQLGAYSIMLAEFDRNWHGNTEVFIEAPSLLYAIEVWVRPQANPWNINLRVSNYNDYSIERVWQPLFALGGRYDINEHVRVLAEAECKPTGMFHLDASFYGITARVGASYKF